MAATNRQQSTAHPQFGRWRPEPPDQRDGLAASYQMMDVTDEFAAIVPRCQANNSRMAVVCYEVATNATIRKTLLAQIRFTSNIQRHIRCPSREVKGRSLRDVLNAYFEGNNSARGYVLDDQGALRHHMAVFINGKPIADRDRLTDAVPADATIDVMQALSGG
ncbi:MAG: MoaD/ThiS family protein [Phycisphaerales bacterium]|nr:MoaD/ThiS family protein [Phycisphaerales bacterium]MCI0677279.1 MoaD/ThiS family protein [Phycisphaerales bacterium]